MMGQRDSSSGLLATLKAVLWSFFGVRRRSDYESDAARLNPIYVIIAAVGVVILFIAILLTIIHFVLAK
jgi:preprotein translocase subunit Sec61beta